MGRTMSEGDDKLYRGVIKREKQITNPEYVEEHRIAREERDARNGGWNEPEFRQRWAEIEAKFKGNVTLLVPGEYVYSYYGPYAKPSTARGQITYNEKRSWSYLGEIVDKYVEELGATWTRLQ